MCVDWSLGCLKHSSIQYCDIIARVVIIVVILVVVIVVVDVIVIIVVFVANRAIETRRFACFSSALVTTCGLV